MAESRLSIVERESGDVTILVLTGQILLDDGDLAIRLKIHDLVDRGKLKLVLDMGGVSYVDSAGVGMLAAKQKTLRGRGGDLKLLNLTTRGQRDLRHREAAAALRDVRRRSDGGQELRLSRPMSRLRPIGSSVSPKVLRYSLSR